MECTVPVQYIGPGHSAPRDQCRGNTQPYYRSSSFGNSFPCNKMFKVRVFTQIKILFTSVYFDVVPILYWGKWVEVWRQICLLPNFLAGRPRPQKEWRPNWKRNIPTLEKYFASKNPYLRSCTRRRRDKKGKSQANQLTEGGFLPQKRILIWWFRW